MVFSFTKKPYSYMDYMVLSYFFLSTVYILIRDNMRDKSKNNVLRILKLFPNLSIRIAVFQIDNAADIEIPKEIKTSSKLLL